MLRVLGQISASFIIAEGPDGMYLIDQHAAHERVLYERILGQMRERSVDRQTLLDPLVVDLAPEKWLPSSARRPSCPRSASRSSAGTAARWPSAPFPRWSRASMSRQRLRLILRELAEGGQGESWLDAVAISTACHTSIRAGQALSIPEMRELVSPWNGRHSRAPAATADRRCCTSPAAIWRSSSSGGR